MMDHPIRERNRQQERDERAQADADAQAVFHRSVPLVGGYLDQVAVGIAAIDRDDRAARAARSVRGWDVLLEEEQAHFVTGDRASGPVLLGDDLSIELVLLLVFFFEFAVAPRFEYFSDGAGIVSGAVQALKSFTLTGELKSAQGVIFKIEYRRDQSDIDFFTKSGASVNNQNTFSASMVYAFSSNAK